MTKYILNSGGIGNSTDQGSRFFNEMVEGLGTEPKILLCHFAQPREDWEAKFKQYADAIASVLPQSIQPIFDLALPHIFAEQIERPGRCIFTEETII